jgi:hypothetical protein
MSYAQSLFLRLGFKCPCSDVFADDPFSSRLSRMIGHEATSGRVFTTPGQQVFRSSLKLRAI